MHGELAARPLDDAAQHLHAPPRAPAVTSPADQLLARQSEEEQKADGSGRG